MSRIDARLQRIEKRQTSGSSQPVSDDIDELEQILINSTEDVDSFERKLEATSFRHKIEIVNKRNGTLSRDQELDTLLFSTTSIFKPAL